MKHLTANTAKFQSKTLKLCKFAPPCKIFKLLAIQIQIFSCFPILQNHINDYSKIIHQRTSTVNILDTSSINKMHLDHVIVSFKTHPCCYCLTSTGLLLHLWGIIAAPLWRYCCSAAALLTHLCRLIVTPSRRYCHTFVVLLLFHGCLLAAPSPPYYHTFEALLPHLCSIIAVLRPPYCCTFTAFLSHLRGVIATPLWCYSCSAALLWHLCCLIAHFQGSIVAPLRWFCDTFLFNCPITRHLLSVC